MGDEETDHHYPETEGYSDLVESHAQELETFAGLRSDDASRKFLEQRLHFAEESGHVGRWFMLRHTELHASGESERLRAEARQLQLLDTSCDAANAHFVRLHGSGYASDAAQIRASAKEGIKMAFGMLGSPMGASTGMHQRFSQLIDEYIARIVARHKAQKKEAERAKRLAAKERQKELAALAAAEKAAQRKPMRNLVLLGLFVLMLAASFNSQGAAP